VSLVREISLPYRIANLYTDANIATHKPSKVGEMIKALKEAGLDTICIIPPAHVSKFTITSEVILAAKKENIPNILFMSYGGIDMAERHKQPHLRDLIDLECLIMAEDIKVKKVTEFESHVIVRAGFCAEVRAQPL
jgi:hypothetical protein